MNGHEKITARLFRISFINHGNASAEEIQGNLSQSKFAVGGVYLLDFGPEMFLWIGLEVYQASTSQYELGNLIYIQQSIQHFVINLFGYSWLGFYQLCHRIKR